MDPATINAILRLVPTAASAISQFVGLAQQEGSITDEEVAAIQLDLDTTHNELKDRIAAAKARRDAAGNG